MYLGQERNFKQRHLIRALTFFPLWGNTFWKRYYIYLWKIESPLRIKRCLSKLHGPPLQHPLDVHMMVKLEYEKDNLNLSYSNSFRGHQILFIISLWVRTILFVAKRPTKHMERSTVVSSFGSKWISRSFSSSWSDRVRPSTFGISTKVDEKEDQKRYLVLVLFLYFDSYIISRN